MTGRFLPLDGADEDQRNHDGNNGRERPKCTSRRNIPPAPATEPATRVATAPTERTRLPGSPSLPVGDVLDQAGDGAGDKRSRQAATASSGSFWSVAHPGECRPTGTTRLPTACRDTTS